MNTLSLPDQVWNRACEGGGDQPALGDRALSSMLLFHGLVMNGGILHAVECLSDEQLIDAIHGYEYFNLSQVSDLIKEAIKYRFSEDQETVESKLNSSYAATVEDDEYLVSRLEDDFKNNPSSYSDI